MLLLPLFTMVVDVTAPVVKFKYSDSVESENISDLKLFGEEDTIIGDRVIVVAEDDSIGVSVCVWCILLLLIFAGRIVTMLCLICWFCVWLL